MTAVGKGWARRLPSLEMEVDCRGAKHCIRWVRGSVVVVDHDLAAERAVVALGGDPLPCMQVALLFLPAAKAGEAQRLLRWNERLVGDAQAPSRWPTPAATRTLMAALSRGAPAFSSTLRGQSLVAGLPEGIVDRIALGSVVRLARRPPEDELEALDLAMAVSLRARRAVEASLHTWTRRPVHRLPPIECRLAAPGDVASVAGSWTEGYVVQLPPRWLPEVWAPGSAMVDGCFVLDVARPPRSETACRIVTWERTNAGDGVPVVRSARRSRSSSGWRLRLT